VAQLLIDKGANLERSDLHFGRPLHITALTGFVRSAKVLLLAGNMFAASFTTAIYIAQAFHSTIKNVLMLCLKFVVMGLIVWI